MSIGVNLRVTGHCRQGGRRYMEDYFSVAYQQTEDEKDLEYAFFGIYDGHGGAEAAAFAKEHLMETIIKYKSFWSDEDEEVLRAIKDGYIATHYAMWREQEKWPKTASGLPSTAGTTASVAFIRRGKIYIGHVGDSGITLGYQDPHSLEWRAQPLTKDHKPENEEEIARIQHCGGKVVAKSGVPRVVWNRPKIGHQGPVRRSTPIDEIPFLAVARSLGDLWSYNSQLNEFVVSPDPDCSVIKIDTNVHRCLIFGTDGLYNMLSPQMAVNIVQQAEKHNENAALGEAGIKTWLNPSKLLVEKALERWFNTKMRADNTSAVTLMLDPPGPPRAQVLKNRRNNNETAYPQKGLEIMTRFQDTESPMGTQGCSSAPQMSPQASVTSSEWANSYTPLKEHNFVPKTRESTAFDPRSGTEGNNCPNEGQTPVKCPNEGENSKSPENSDELDNSIQINEISSSSNDSEVTSSLNSVFLRSQNKSNDLTSQNCEKENSVAKRRLSETNLGPTRKSMRLDNKKTDEIVESTKTVVKLPKTPKMTLVSPKNTRSSTVSAKMVENQAKVTEKLFQNTQNFEIVPKNTRSSKNVDFMQNNSLLHEELTKKRGKSNDFTEKPNKNEVKAKITEVKAKSSEMNTKTSEIRPKGLETRANALVSKTLIPKSSQAIALVSKKPEFKPKLTENPPKNPNFLPETRILRNRPPSPIKNHPKPISKPKTLKKVLTPLQESFSKLQLPKKSPLPPKIETIKEQTRFSPRHSLNKILTSPLVNNATKSLKNAAKINVLQVVEKRTRSSGNLGIISKGKAAKNIAKKGAASTFRKTLRKIQGSTSKLRKNKK